MATLHASGSIPDSRELQSSGMDAMISQLVAELHHVIASSTRDDELIDIEHVQPLQEQQHSLQCNAGSNRQKVTEKQPRMLAAA